MSDAELFNQLGFDDSEADAIREAADTEDELVSDFIFNAAIDRASNTLGRAI